MKQLLTLSILAIGLVSCGQEQEHRNLRTSADSEPNTQDHRDLEDVLREIAFDDSLSPDESTEVIFSLLKRMWKAGGTLPSTGTSKSSSSSTTRKTRKVFYSGGGVSNSTSSPTNNTLQGVGAAETTTTSGGSVSDSNWQKGTPTSGYQGSIGNVAPTRQTISPRIAKAVPAPSASPKPPAEPANIHGLPKGWISDSSGEYEASEKYDMPIYVAAETSHKPAAPIENMEIYVADEISREIETEIVDLSGDDVELDSDKEITWRVPDPIPSPSPESTTPRVGFIGNGGNLSRYPTDQCNQETPKIEDCLAHVVDDFTGWRIVKTCIEKAKCALRGGMHCNGIPDNRFALTSGSSDLETQSAYAPQMKKPCYPVW